MGEMRGFVDNTNNGRSYSLFGPRNEENEYPLSHHLSSKGREGILLMRRGNSNEGKFREEVNHGQFQLQTLTQSSDRGISDRENDSTSSRFQWTSFLHDSRNLSVDGVKKDFQHCRLYDGYGRKYDSVVEKSVPTETEQIRNLPTCSQGVGEYMGLPRNLSVPVLGDDNSFRARDYSPHQDWEMSRRICDDRSFSGFCSHGNSLILTSGQHNPSHGISMDTPRGLRQEIYRPSDACINGNNVQPERCDNHHQMCSRAGTKIHPREEYIRSVGRPSDYSPQESPRSCRLRPRALPEDIYDKAEHVQDYNDHGENVANDTLQRLGNICYSQKLVSKEDGLQRFGDASQEKPYLDNYGVKRLCHEPQSQGLGLIPGGCYHQYGIEAIENYEALAHEEEQKHYVTGQQGRLFFTDEDTQQGMESGEFCFSEKPNKMPKRKNRSVGTESRPKRRATTIGSRGVFSHNDVPSVGSFSHHSDIQWRENVGVSKAKTEHPFGGLSEALQRRLSKPQESGRGDIQKRLKHPHIVPHPCYPQPHNVWRKDAQNYVKPYPNVFNAISTPQPPGSTKSTKFTNKLKTSLARPATQDHEISLPGPNIEQQHKSSIKILGSTKAASQSQEDDIDHLKLMVKPTENDLPEHSEEFKKQVHECFLKCLQHLTANSGRYRRFKEQGKAGSLKCIICLSSKEFMETKSIATHAFASPKIGLRAQHLGFHRAICVLMGWDSGTTPNGHWVCQTLPDADGRALKEDVIIWPPVVIVHNSYAGNYNQNDQVKISTKHIVTMLRDEGFDEGKAKVCQGKAGSTDIMVVKFSGTLSGLQQAERLHNIFAEKNHGRNELLQQATSKIISSEDPQSQVPVNTLYGYLGIIEDSDKLPYDMKRHCCAKSKKGIRSFADKTTTW